jgi:hypothetical protein
MKLPPFHRLLFLPLLLFAIGGRAAEPQTWAGEYTDKKFLNGSAVFQLSIEQQGKDIQVSFDATYNDGHSCSPEAQGMAKSNGQGLQFTFQDGSGNTGTGTIARVGSDLVVSLKPTRVVAKECIVFYRENIRLTRVGK